MSDQSRGTSSLEWSRLDRTIHHCQRCPLSRNRIHAVSYRGGTDPQVVFIGEAPGAEEDRRGIPFVGAAGKRLDEAIAGLMLGEEQVGIVNVLKCRPPENRFDPRAAVVCRPYLDQQLTLLDPKVIVTLGRWALLSLAPDAPPILRSAGTPRKWNGRPWMPLLHPASTFRSRQFQQRWEVDLGSLRRLLPQWLNETL